MFLYLGAFRCVKKYVIVCLTFAFLAVIKIFKLLFVKIIYCRREIVTRTENRANRTLILFM